MKDPITRSRVSRIRPADEWIIHDVPELRIVSEEVWGDVKRRQDAQKPQRQAHWNGRDRNRLSGSQALRRRKYLLSGLLECGCCGGRMTVAGAGGHKRYYCANRRQTGPDICMEMPGLRQSDAEELVLAGFRRQLMLPVAYSFDISASSGRLPRARHARNCAETGTTLRPLASTVLPRGRRVMVAVAANISAACQAVLWSALPTSAAAPSGMTE